MTKGYKTVQLIHPDGDDDVLLFVQTVVVVEFELPSEKIQIIY